MKTLTKKQFLKQYQNKYKQLNAGSVLVIYESFNISDAVENNLLYVYKNFSDFMDQLKTNYYADPNDQNLTGKELENYLLYITDYIELSKLKNNDKVEF